MTISIQLSALHVTVCGTVPQALMLQDSMIQTPVLWSAVGYTTAVPTAVKRSCMDTYFEEGWGESPWNATTESSSQQVWKLGKDNRQITQDCRAPL